MSDAIAILSDLAAPVRSFRIFALEQAIRSGTGEDLLQALTARQTIETDPECKLLLVHAIGMVRERMIMQTAGGSSATAGQDPLSTFTQGDSARRLAVLERLVGRAAEPLVPYVHEWLRAEADPVVAVAIIRRFAPLWPVAHLDALAARLRSTYLMERLAALEALIQLAPDRLVNELPDLLADADPRLRALAVQGLARIDLDAALEHLEAMLGSSDPDLRRCGVQNCNFLPFEQVKPLLLQHLAAETEPTLIELAGLVLQVNPDPEIPVRLLDMVELAAPRKARRLQPILEGACRAIEASGLLGSRYPEYLERLRQSVRARQARRRVQAAIAQALAADDPDELAILGADLGRDPLLREAVQAALAAAPVAMVRQTLQNLLSSGTAADGDHRAVADDPATSSPPPRTVLTGYEPALLAARDQVRLLTLWDLRESEAARPVVESLLNDRTLAPEARAATLRHALRLGLDGFVEQVGPLVDSTDERVAAAALAYLGRFDVDRVGSRLGNLVMAPGVRLKSVAVAVLRSIDHAQATRALATMLNPRNAPAQQTAALGCLAWFDFALVRGILLEYLLRGPADEQFAMGLALFVGNPERENLSALYGLEQTVTEERRTLVVEVRRQNVVALTDLGVMSAADAAAVDETLADKHRRRLARARAQQPAYALRSVRPESAAEEPLAMPIPVRLRRLILAFVVCVVVAGVWWSTGDVGRDSDPRAGPVLALPTLVSGTIESVGGAAGSATLRSDRGDTYVLMPTGSVLRGLKPGDRIKATVIPFRVDNSGRVIAQARLVEAELSSSLPMNGTGAASSSVEPPNTASRSAQ